MDPQQQNNEPKREDRPNDGAKVMTPAQKKAILFGSQSLLGGYLFTILLEGSSIFLFYPELYDFKTYSVQLLSREDFLSDSLLTLLGLLQLPFVILLFQALTRKNLDKYLTAKKLFCIPWVLEFFKVIIRVRQDIDIDIESPWTWPFLICDGVSMVVGAILFWRDKKIRESFQDEKRESPNHNFERNENGAEEDETSVHLDKLNSYGFVIYKYWILISGLWTIQWLYLIFIETLQIKEDDSEKIDSTVIIMSLTALGGIALIIWHIFNCFLVFEAIRRKNLKKVESSIKYMEIYSIAAIVLVFFGFGNETFRNFVKKEDPEIFDMNSMTWTLIIVAFLLVWRIYYHFAYTHGVYKVRDALKAHEKSKHSQ